MNTFKFLVSAVILLGILSCSKISEKIEKKVNEKVDQTIDENLKKIDSTLNKSDLDSLKKLMKSLDSVNTNDNAKSNKK